MAYIAEPRVRETSTTTGTSDLTLAGAMYGSLAFSEVMTTGDTCDYCINYDTCFEEGLGTFGADGKLQRTTIYRARQPDGTVNATKVSLPSGIKTVIMTVRASKVSVVHAAQSFSQAERDRLCTNLGLPKSGDKAVCPQASAWIGWTKDNSQHDAALRIVTDNSGGDTGGSVNFSTLHARTATDPYTITQPNLPNVTLTTNVTDNRTWSVNVYAANNDQKQGNTGSGSSAFTLTQYSVTVSGTISGSTPLGGSGTPFTVPIDMRVKYRNVILVIKD